MKREQERRWTKYCVRNVLVKREPERIDQVRSVRNVLVKREDGTSEEC